MPIYDLGKSDADGRGMSRALERLHLQIRANTRVSAAGNIPDPTPPPDVVEPGSLTNLSLKGISYDG